jgi:hypothetical protein
MEEIYFDTIDSDNNIILIQKTNNKRLMLKNTIQLRQALSKKTLVETHSSSKINIKELQKAIISGSTIADVAQNLNLSEDIVRRYAIIILQKKQFTIDKAKRIIVNGKMLNDLILEKLFKANDIKWDCIMPNNIWILKILWTDSNGNSKVAEFSLDKQVKDIKPINNEAELLIETNKNDDLINIIANSNTENEILVKDLNTSRGKFEPVQNPIDIDTQYKNETFVENKTETILQDSSNILNFPQVEEQIDKPIDKQVNNQIDNPTDNQTNTSTNTKQDYLNSSFNIDKNALDSKFENKPVDNNKDNYYQKTVNNNKTAKKSNNTTGSIKRSKVPTWDEIIFDNKD